MNPRSLLTTAVIFTLPAWTLTAQDNPDPRPSSPPRDGEPRREGGARPDAEPRRENPPRPDGARREGEARRENPQRPMPGIFNALDANHDGVIDAQEMSQAADVLRKLDRNGDGKVGIDEFRPAGEPPRRTEGREPGGNVRREGEQARLDGDRGQRGPRPEARPGQPRGEGERRTEGRAPQEGERRAVEPREGPGREQAPRDPRADGRRESRPDQARAEGERRPEAREEVRRDRAAQPPQPPRPQDESRRDDQRRDGVAPRDGAPQAFRHHHHRHLQPGGPQGGPRFAHRGPQPGADRPAFRPPFEAWKPKPFPNDRFAMMQRHDSFAPKFQPEERRDARGPAPQFGPRDFAAPRGDWKPGFQPPREFKRDDHFQRPPLRTPNFDRGMHRPPSPPPSAKPNDPRLQHGAHEDGRFAPATV